MSEAYPFLGVTQPVESNSLPLFKMYAWNFDEDCFQRDGNGHRILLTGDDALKVWIYKVCRTERYVWLAYSRRFGIELVPFIGKNMNVGERRSEIQRMIIEAILVNPYVKSIDSIELNESNHGKDLEISVSLTTIYGQITV